MTSGAGWCAARAWFATSGGHHESICGEDNGHLGDHYDAYTGKRWANDPLNYPDPDEEALTVDLAQKMARAFAADDSGRSGVTFVQQAVHDFDPTRVLVSLATLTGVLARVLGSAYPGGVDGIFDTLIDPLKETSP